MNWESYYLTLAAESLDKNGAHPDVCLTPIRYGSSIHLLRDSFQLWLCSQDPHSLCISPSTPTFFPVASHTVGSPAMCWHPTWGHAQGLKDASRWRKRCCWSSFLSLHEPQCSLAPVPFRVPFLSGVEEGDDSRATISDVAQQASPEIRALLLGLPETSFTRQRRGWTS